MEKYIGVKIVQAKPMNLFEAEEKLQRKISQSAQNQEGYLVKYEDGYLSWSPKGIFEEANRKTDGMTFGLAVEALKKGFRVCRKGWNGKGMFLYLTSGSIVPIVNLKPETSKALFGERLLECDQTIEIKSHIDMKAADGTITIGWNATQVDMLAEDWMIVE
ncbi:DUF2829 domain-containing protein [Anaerosinus massiliensis]|uniref:DUF2829 domain-containing protein n=1 Tax=Massilibacillus massiliensis TaxID=1806837 RepID=UPI000A951256|nr:DUF2829 domain-containing protein [Massilibacillus massiliensis]